MYINLFNFRKNKTKMSKIEYAQILLNKPIYYSGEIMLCTFKFRVRENTKCNSVDIILRGYASCYWYFIIK